MNRARTVLLQIRDFLAGLPPARRASFLALSAATLAATVGFLVWVQRPQYAVLLARLEPSDASAVVDYLKSAKVPYRIGADGTTIEVPQSALHEARMSLAARGLPQGGTIGFEIFDKQTLGMTDFVQRLDFQRALQGELARTITSLAVVEAARVHLALPERSLFVSEDRKPSASVVLKLRPGRTLTPEQVGGIANLVAASVERLAPTDVTIVDVSGDVLSSARAEGRERGPADAMRAYQTEIEQAYVERIESMLERALGPGHAVARVTATLDLAQVERTEELVDPDRIAIKSEKRNVESNKTSSASGVPGVTATLTNDPAGAAATTGDAGSQREDATVSYEVSRVTSRRVEPMGAIRKLSVAVLIDGVARGDGASKEFAPRPPEELARYEELVKRVVGFSEERGDQIEVVSEPFVSRAPETIEGPGLLDRVAGSSDVIWRVVGIALFLVLALRVVRPFLLAMASRAPAPQRELIAAVEQAALPQPSDFGRDLGEIARQNPQQTAMVIRQWVGAERRA
ncbi:MAG: flagellar basal-body MS-ring/collar protein FliF [Thermodesulfobacteriota bacterium]